MSRPMDQVQALRIGQKVVRITVEDGETGSHPSAAKEVGGYTKVGGVYTIRWVGEWSFCSVTGEKATIQAIRLDEMVRCTRSKAGVVNTDIPSAAYLFRPLVEDTKKAEVKTSIDIFRRIADGTHRVPDEQDA